MTFGIKELKKTCECGEDIRTDMQFPNGVENFLKESRTARRANVKTHVNATGKTSVPDLIQLFKTIKKPTDFLNKLTLIQYKAYVTEMTLGDAAGGRRSSSSPRARRPTPCSETRRSLCSRMNMPWPGCVKSPFASQGFSMFCCSPRARSKELASLRPDTASSRRVRSGPHVTRLPVSPVRQFTHPDKTSSVGHEQVIRPATNRASD